MASLELLCLIDIHHFGDFPDLLQLLRVCATMRVRTRTAAIFQHAKLWFLQKRAAARADARDAARLAAGLPPAQPLIRHRSWSSIDTETSGEG